MWLLQAVDHLGEAVDEAVDEPGHAGSDPLDRTGREGMGDQTAEPGVANLLNRSGLRSNVVQWPAVINSVTA